MFRNTLRAARNILPKRSFAGHAKQARPAERPKDFEGFMRWYLPEDHHVVMFIVGSWTAVAMLIKGVLALTSKPKPKQITNHATTSHAPKADDGAIPTDIDAFLTWMEADSGNLDKALASL